MTAQPPRRGPGGLLVGAASGYARDGRRLDRERPAPTVHLALAGRADNVALVREVLAGLSERVQLGSALGDIRTAVSEACNNAVMHAYRGEEGPLEVELLLSTGELAVLVRDRGIGGVSAHREQDDEDPLAAGLGLEIIRSLSSGCSINSEVGRGTELRMSFAIPGPTSGHTALERGGARRFQRLGAESDVEIAIAPATLGGPILSRLVAVFAARADFSTDRLSDALLLSDSLSARIGVLSPETHLRVGLASHPRALEWRIGGLRGPAQLVDAQIAAVANLAARLNAQLVRDRCADGASATIVMRDARRPVAGWVASVDLLP